MEPVTKYNHFVEALESQEAENRYIVCTEETWRYENCIERIIRKVLHFFGIQWWENYTLAKIDRFCCNLLDKCEHLALTNAPNIQNPSLALKRRLIALDVRIGEEAKCVPDTSDLEMYANEFLKNSYGKRDQINEYDRARIQEAASNTQFYQLLLDDSDYRKKFFHWTLIEGNLATPIIHYPYHFQRLSDSLLTKRIGFHQKRNPGKTILKMGFNQLNLSVEGKMINMLDPQESRAIYQIFAEKFYDVGPKDLSYEMFEGGEIISYNPKHHLRDNREIDLEAKDWYLNIPPVESLFPHDVKERYKVDVTGKETVLAVCATMMSDQYDLMDNHSYLEVLVPVEGMYRRLTFGKFTAEYPRTAKDYVDVVTKVLPAVVCSPDENIFNSERALKAYPKVLTDDQRDKLLGLLRKEMLNGRNENIVFQYLAFNCTEWTQAIVQEVLGEKKIPNTFEVPLNKLNVPGTPGRIIKIVRNWRRTLSFLFRLAGSKDRKEYIRFDGEKATVSLAERAPWDSDRRKVFHPCHLAQVEGVVTIDV